MFCEIDTRTDLPSTTTTQKIQVQLKDKNLSPKTTKTPKITSKKTSTVSTFPSTTTTIGASIMTTLKATEPPKSTKTPNETQHLLYSNYQPGSSLEVSEEYQTQIEESLVVSRNKNIQEEEAFLNRNQLTEAETAFVNMNNDLGFRMYRDLLKTESSSNLIFSPFSAITFIATIFLGSRGSTFRQINQLLPLNQITDFDPHVWYKNVTESLINEESFSKLKFLLIDKVNNTK